mmetsp:Transcript_59307/g.171359  ORF Transcript_59307/g.171359 Transcript_59307/m.171359 type:complete len:117 (-) Transcript_59307:70-420(-)
MVQLSKRFADQGLVIVAFPCNQFLNQEPGSADDINKKVLARSFEPPAMLLMDKVRISNGKGGEGHPVFRYLVQKTQARIRWNFGAYFLASKTGEVQGFSGVAPKSLTEKVEALCSA